MVESVCRDAASAATFQFLCVLDRVVAIEGPGEKGKLVLYYVAPDGKRTLLSDPPDFPNEYLHDQFKGVE